MPAYVKRSLNGFDFPISVIMIAGLIKVLQKYSKLWENEM